MVRAQTVEDISDELEILDGLELRDRVALSSARPHPFNQG
jgi:hypothetical protein